MKTLKQFFNWLTEAESPEPGFSIEHLKTIGSGPVRQKTVNQILSYITGLLGEPDWEGSSRYTWILDENTVLKVIQKEYRIAQNENELRNSKCLGPSHSIQVLDYHPDFYWLVEERVTPMTEAEFVAEFNKHLGTNFENRTRLTNDYDTRTSLLITDIIEEAVEGTKRDDYEQFYPIFFKSPWFVELIKGLKGCKVSSSDFHHENWGIRPSTGEFVILDLGF